MMGLNKNSRHERGRSRALARVTSFVRRFAGDRSANVLIMFGLTLPILLAIAGAGIDFGYAEDAKVQLQDASDAASLAVSAEVAKNPNDTVQTLQTLAQNVLTANYTQTGGTAPTINDFHVCAPVQNDCTDGATTLANNTVLVSATATAPCLPLPIPTTVCQGSPPGQVVNASTNTVVGFGATLQINVAMDSSASMIVGATPGDVTTISNWVSNNWSLVKPGDPAPYTGKDNPPCAFACHDVDSSTTPADIALGLTHAHSAGATTRFDVMIAAANQLITHVQSLSTSSSQLAKNTYVFNIYSFDTAVHKYGSTNMSYASATNAVASVAPGLDTYINNAMSTFAGSGGNAIGPNGNGTSTSSPLKFMILVTDGLQSDRNLNWQNCTHWGMDNWGFASSCLAGGFDVPMSTASCTTLKNEGVVLAVLETPYVPLTGQDPHNTPYEGTVRHVIYPGGPNGGNPVSVVSQALQNCATTGYYFQAVNSSDIATGFLQLTDKFVQQHSYISK
ncbi:MAG TPA: TadE/TadG family type IV pilus assembly protein [Caulobacteraceae bacterium]|nr:TadE/TadG family type IV pilus assembly protein [Caulobacteraceae bacterium]